MRIPIGVTAEPGSSTRNKTGSWRVAKPGYCGPKPCTGCQSCVRACPEGAITARDGKKLGTDYQFCKGCGICAAVCPVKGLAMEEER
jgi:pyruvate ferredoxin oxidoreductase delta subunit